MILIENFLNFTILKLFLTFNPTPGVYRGAIVEKSLLLLSKRALIFRYIALMTNLGSGMFVTCEKNFIAWVVIIFQPHPYDEGILYEVKMGIELHGL